MMNGTTTTTTTNGRPQKTEYNSGKIDNSEEHKCTQHIVTLYKNSNILVVLVSTPEPVAVRKQKKIIHFSHATALHRTVNTEQYSIAITQHWRFDREWFVFCAFFSLH